PGAALGLASSTLTITDTDTAGTIQFSAPNYSAEEAGGVALVTVTRTGGTGTASVTLQTTDGTAVAGTEYQNATQTLTFNTGVLSQTVPITLLDDGGAAGNKFLNLTLSQPGNGTSLGAQAAAVLWIVD
ncbi:MAG TPA: Calx-beta domain-containing protein, partial [Vicinamibacteria bacterium]|nr:Calx-beta domain-containing protein [Vicinamibacteria bacterium]